MVYVRNIISLCLALLFFVSSVWTANIAMAAALTNSYNTMSRLSVDAASDHAIQFRTPTGVSTGQTIVVTFPADFDGSNDGQGALDFSDVDLFEDTTPDNVCDGTAETLVASGATSAQWNAAFSSTENRVLTLTSGGASAIIAAASEVCIKIGENATGGSANSQYINTSTDGSKIITLSVGSGADTGSVTVNILSNDQVSVTATVAQSITFSVSDNTIEFGSLSASAATYADDSGGNAAEVEAHTLIVGTNAANGYTLTATGTTLTCSACGNTTITAIGSSNTASSAGTEQFGIRMTASGGSGAVSAPYADSGFAFDSAAFPDEVAASTVASSNTTYSVRYLANITSATEAGAYSTAMTYVATANY
jgi:hypothetical protein